MPKSVVILSRTGCLLPFLIIFNLFFGWIFFRPLVWIATEALILLLFSLNLIILKKKIFSSQGRRDDVIDVEGEILQDRGKLK